MEHVHILLVSEEYDYVDALAIRLQARGMQVQVAYTVAVALQKMQQKPKPDVVILTSCVKECPDAYAVLDAIQAASPLTKVIVLGDDEDNAHKEAVLKHGAFSYLQKSVDPADMKGIDAIMKNISLAFKQNVGDALVAASLAEGGAHDAAQDVLSEEEVQA